MYFSKNDIDSLDKIKRLNLINSVTGIKPGNLIGSISNSGNTNLTVISSVVHLSSNPPLIGYFVRPHKDFRRDTFNNILENEVYTINHITDSAIKKAHYTSAKFDAAVSEFEVCKFTEEYLQDFKAPFVKESIIKMGLQLEELINIKSSGTTMVVGKIIHLLIPDQILNERFYVNLDTAKSVGISGLNSYYSLKFIESLPFARVNQIPSFNV